MRMSKAAAYESLVIAARNIKEASHGDGRTSRADMREMLKTLTGTEKDLTSVFFRFIDHRDAADGASVTDADLMKALAFAQEKMINAYDVNNNGLDKKEVGKMKTTGKLAVKFAEERREAAVSGGEGGAVSGGEGGYVSGGEGGYVSGGEGGHVSGGEA